MRLLLLPMPCVSIPNFFCSLVVDYSYLSIQEPFPLEDCHRQLAFYDRNRQATVEKRQDKSAHFKL